MSRIGRKPITIPAGVQVTLKDGVVTAKGPKGELTQKVHSNITVTIEGNEILVSRPNDEKENRALHGLTRTLIANMVEGVANGFSKELEVNGVGYRVAKQGYIPGIGEHIFYVYIPQNRRSKLGIMGPTQLN